MLSRAGSVDQELLLRNEYLVIENRILRAQKPDTILARHRRLIATKFDGSRKREYPGRPQN